MKIHHLNCGTLCPWARRLVNGEGGLFEPGLMVCHCLLVEADDGLVLVETGLGLDDVTRATARLGAGFVAVARPRLDPEETAARRVERLGFQRRDVRHVVLTHLDLDHAGGLADFPDAAVHVYETEYAAAMRPRTFLEQERYRNPHWSHGPRWKVHATSGDTWMGFECVRALAGVAPEILLVPLIGHSRGHSGVAVRSGTGWLLHAGDAFFSHREMEARPSCPPALAQFQRVAAVWNDRRLENQGRLRALARERVGEVDVVCAHCPRTFERLAGSSRANEDTQSFAPVPAAS